MHFRQQQPTLIHELMIKMKKEEFIGGTTVGLYVTKTPTAEEASNSLKKLVPSTNDFYTSTTLDKVDVGKEAYAGKIKREMQQVLHLFLTISPTKIGQMIRSLVVFVVVCVL